MSPGLRANAPASSIERAWRTIRKAAGLDGVRLHDLRHTAASMLVNAGASFYTVGRVLGHRRPETTQRYAHLADSVTLAAVDGLAAQLSGGVA